MTTSTPLRQLIEPGTFRTQWVLPAQTGQDVLIEGDIELRPDAPPLAMAYGDFPEMGQSLDGTSWEVSYPQTYPTTDVMGNLLNGYSVLMTNPTVTILMPERISVNSAAAIVGRKPFPEGPFSITDLRIQITGLDAVMGTPPLSSLQMPEGGLGSDHLDWKWGVAGNPASTHVWQDDEAGVEVRFDATSSFMDFHAFKVAFSPVLEVHFGQPISMDEMVDAWVEPLRRIISLATNRREAITHLMVAFERDGAKEWCQVFGSAILQESYVSSRNEVNRARESLAFTVDKRGLSLLELIRRWQCLSSERHPLLETYGSLMFVRERHPRSRLLLLLQALEGAHGHENREAQSAATEAFAEKREMVLARLKEFRDSGTLSGAMFQFLRKNVAKKPHFGLSEAVAAALKDGPIDLTPRLRVAPVLADHDSVTDGLRVIRNHLAHGTHGYAPEDLAVLVGPLEALTRSQVLRALGCGPEAQRRALEAATA